MFTNPTLTLIGEKYGKTAVQVALRWLLQSDVIIIPKTVHKERMQENLNLFDFELDAEEMQAIANLDTTHSLFLDHHSGETTKQAACTAWLNTNRPSEKNGLKDTADYQRVQKLKRAFAFSNINQVIYKYMDDKGNIKLPESITPTTKPDNGVGGGGEIET